MPSDFRQFQQMMAVEFGERFTKLFRGPAWSGLDPGDFQNPYKVRKPYLNINRLTIQ